MGFAQGLRRQALAALGFDEASIRPD